MAIHKIAHSVWEFLLALLVIPPIMLGLAIEDFCYWIAGRRKP